MLIELLVVIAILASLLLLPLSIAREDSRRAVCQSQLKQLRLGLYMHNDGNGRLLTMQTEPGETITLLPDGSILTGYSNDFTSGALTRWRPSGSLVILPHR